jgi:hypothetical protein
MLTAGGTDEAWFAMSAVRPTIFEIVGLAPSPLPAVLDLAKRLPDSGCSVQRPIDRL